MAKSRISNRQIEAFNSVAECKSFTAAALSFLRTFREVKWVADTLSQLSDHAIRVAAPMVIASPILPPIIAEFRARHPHLDVEIVETGVEWLGESDLQIGFERPRSAG